MVMSCCTLSWSSNGWFYLFSSTLHWHMGSHMIAIWLPQCQWSNPAANGLKNHVFLDYILKMVCIMKTKISPMKLCEYFMGNTALSISLRALYFPGDRDERCVFLRQTNPILFDQKAHFQRLEIGAKWNSMIWPTFPLQGFFHIVYHVNGTHSLCLILSRNEWIWIDKNKIKKVWTVCRILGISCISDPCYYKMFSHTFR